MLTQKHPKHIFFFRLHLKALISVSIISENLKVAFQENEKQNESGGWKLPSGGPGLGPSCPLVAPKLLRTDAAGFLPPPPACPKAHSPPYKEAGYPKLCLQRWTVRTNFHCTPSDCSCAKSYGDSFRPK